MLPICNLKREEVDRMLTMERAIAESISECYMNRVFPHLVLQSVKFFDLCQRDDAEAEMQDWFTEQLRERLDQSTAIDKQLCTMDWNEMAESFTVRNVNRLKFVDRSMFDELKWDDILSSLRPITPDELESIGTGDRFEVHWNGIPIDDVTKFDATWTDDVTKYGCDLDTSRTLDRRRYELSGYGHELVAGVSWARALLPLKTRRVDEVIPPADVVVKKEGSSSGVLLVTRPRLKITRFVINRSRFIINLVAL
ncbi:hypothetical protein TNCV_922481 [Trichonephila clavipes]|nr:hypothetical protein TNCV_922481 [Trichonephila clavipes]